MLDLILLAAMLAFFAAFYGFTQVCDRI